MRFLQTGTSTPFAGVNALFKGDTAPSVGGSEDDYYRDINNNGFIDGGDFTGGFGGSPLANIYLRIDGTPGAVPEPTSFAALALGALALVRRRKRA